VRRNTAQFRRSRYCGTVIAGRMRCDTAPRGYVVKRKHCVRCATCLERTDLLKILALKKERNSARFIQALARQHERTMNMRLDPLMRRKDRG